MRVGHPPDAAGGPLVCLVHGQWSMVCPINYLTFNLHARHSLLAVGAARAGKREAVMAKKP